MSSAAAPPSVASFHQEPSLSSPPRRPQKTSVSPDDGLSGGGSESDKNLKVKVKVGCHAVGATQSKPTFPSPPTPRRKGKEKKKRLSPTSGLKCLTLG